MFPALQNALASIMSGSGEAQGQGRREIETSTSEAAPSSGDSSEVVPKAAASVALSMSMTVVELKDYAKERDLKIPSVCKTKAAILDHLLSLSSEENVESEGGDAVKKGRGGRKKEGVIESAEIPASQPIAQASQARRGPSRSSKAAVSVPQPDTVEVAPQRALRKRSHLQTDSALDPSQEETEVKSKKQGGPRSRSKKAEPVMEEDEEEDEAVKEASKVQEVAAPSSRARSGSRTANQRGAQVAEVPTRVVEETTKGRAMRSAPDAPAGKKGSVKPAVVAAASPPKAKAAPSAAVQQRDVETEKKPRRGRPPAPTVVKEKPARKAPAEEALKVNLAPVPSSPDDEEDEDEYHDACDQQIEPADADDDAMCDQEIEPADAAELQAILTEVGMDIQSDDDEEEEEQEEEQQQQLPTGASKNQAVILLDEDDDDDDDNTPAQPQPQPTGSSSSSSNSSSSSASIIAAVAVKVVPPIAPAAEATEQGDMSEEEYVKSLEELKRKELELQRRRPKSLGHVSSVADFPVPASNAQVAPPFGLSASSSSSSIGRFSINLTAPASTTGRSPYAGARQQQSALAISTSSSSSLQDTALLSQKKRGFGDVLKYDRDVDDANAISKFRYGHERERAVETVQSTYVTSTVVRPRWSLGTHLVSAAKGLPRGSLGGNGFRENAARLSDVATYTGDTSLAELHRRRLLRRSEGGNSSKDVTNKILDTLNDLARDEDNLGRAGKSWGGPSREPERLDAFSSRSDGFKAGNTVDSWTAPTAAVVSQANSFSSKPNFLPAASNASAVQPAPKPSISAPFAAPAPFPAPVSKPEITAGSFASSVVKPPAKFEAPKTKVPEQQKPQPPQQSEFQFPEPLLVVSLAETKPLDANFQFFFSPPGQNQRDAIDSLVYKPTISAKTTTKASSSGKSASASSSGTEEANQSSASGIASDSVWAKLLRSGDFNCPHCRVSNDKNANKCISCENFMKCPSCSAVNKEEKEMVCQSCKEPFTKGGKAQGGGAKWVPGSAPPAAGGAIGPGGFTFGSAKAVTAATAASLPGAIGPGGFSFGASAASTAPAAAPFTAPTASTFGAPLVAPQTAAAPLVFAAPPASTQQAYPTTSATTGDFSTGPPSFAPKFGAEEKKSAPSFSVPLMSQGFAPGAVAAQKPLENPISATSGVFAALPTSTPAFGTSTPSFGSFNAPAAPPAIITSAPVFGAPASSSSSSSAFSFTAGTSDVKKDQPKEDKPLEAAGPFGTGASTHGQANALVFAAEPPKPAAAAPFVFGAAPTSTASSSSVSAPFSFNAGTKAAEPASAPPASNVPPPFVFGAVADAAKPPASTFVFGAGVQSTAPTPTAAATAVPAAAPFSFGVAPEASSGPAAFSFSAGTVKVADERPSTFASQGGSSEPKPFSFGATGSTPSHQLPPMAPSSKVLPNFTSGSESPGSDMVLGGYGSDTATLSAPSSAPTNTFAPAFGSSSSSSGSALPPFGFAGSIAPANAGGIGLTGNPFASSAPAFPGPGPNLGGAILFPGVPASGGIAGVGGSGGLGGMGMGMGLGMGGLSGGMGSGGSSMHSLNGNQSASSGLNALGGGGAPSADSFVFSAGTANTAASAGFSLGSTTAGRKKVTASKKR